MPQIVSRRLDILYDLGKQQAECIVTCTVNFNEQEQQLESALRYQMECQLFVGSSGCNGADELLHTYELQIIPESTPMRSVDLMFVEVLPAIKLKKDLIKDELYGLLTLINPSIEPIKLIKQTNLIELRAYKCFIN